MLGVGFDAHLIGFSRRTNTRLSQLRENSTFVARHLCPLLSIMLLPYSQLAGSFLEPPRVENLLSAFCGFDNGGTSEYICREERPRCA